MFDTYTRSNKWSKKGLYIYLEISEYLKMLTVKTFYVIDYDKCSSNELCIYNSPPTPINKENLCVTLPSNYNDFRLVKNSTNHLSL